MFVRFEPSAHIRSLIIEKAGVVQAATILESLYYSSFPSPEKALHAIQTSVSDILYGPQQFMKGQLLERLAEFAFTLADKGRSVALVTPNYDMYLYQELFNLYKILQSSSSSHPELRDNIVLTSDKGAPLGAPAANPLFDDPSNLYLMGKVWIVAASRRVIPRSSVGWMNEPHATVVHRVVIVGAGSESLIRP